MEDWKGREKDGKNTRQENKKQAPFTSSETYTYTLGHSTSEYTQVATDGIIIQRPIKSSPDLNIIHTYIL